MKRAEQIEFLRNLSAAVIDRMVEKVKSGHVPEDWDGHELRQWLADKFASETSHRLENKRSKERRDYENVVIVNNL